ncbi:alginate O-acetyltransferase AlgX-related protein [Methylobacterium platani]|uniref:AlgX/AlgJ SGNH hydrolase-like domain-containing protein n=2 Tax=Methylobacterium platani TaxID=427683 RepID=A0A179S6W4_9HYPH|nr:hypothetical protein [Methylobacterium platani]KMO22305.1 hypothetical protein SQ03_00835 [Methylobacterium platani JCM 14648]OAS22560.1 hypothetical protein A5481_19405 [Methylobacterium platani]
MLAGSNLSVVEGREGWLFLERSDGAEPLKAGADLTEWSRTTLPLLRATFRARQARLAARGIALVVVVAPEKASVYDEFLPAGFAQDRPSAAERLTDVLRQDGVKAVDATGLLRQAKGVVPLYYDVDSHWTSFAAYRIYRALVAAAPARLGLTPIPAETIFFRDKPSFGDLGVHLSPERKGLLQQPEVPGGDVEIAVDTFDDREFNFQQHRYPGGRGRALVVRDSFSSFLSPFLSRTFAETTYISPSNSLPDDLVEELSPDLVIVQVAERAMFYAHQPLADWNLRSWRQTFLETQADHPARRHTRRARQALRTGSWAEALEAARKATAVDEDDRLVHNLVAALLHSGDAAGALACCDATKQPANRYRLALEAYALWALERREEAIARIRRALAHQPANAHLQHQAGEWILAQGRSAEALPYLEAAVAGAPAHAPSWYHLGMARHALGDLVGTAAAFQAGGFHPVE